MIKRLLLLYVFFVVLLSLSMTQVVADSPPTLPSSFWGTVKLDGANVEVGTIITAKIGGDVAATAEVEFDAGDTVYVISIPGVETMEGERVDFYIGEGLSDQHSTWQSGTNRQLNLSIYTGEYFYIFIPLIIN